MNIALSDIAVSRTPTSEVWRELILTWYARHAFTESDSKMASRPDGYESGHYSSPEFTTETLFKYKYGVACVSNVDGRGNVSIYAMIRRQRKNSKPIFDYANILIYVGGEIRDGFCNANLKEGEALRFMQTHIELSRGRTIRMISVPVEEVSAMFVLPLQKKAMERGLGFPDPNTASAFEYFKQVAKNCPYQTVEEFFDAKLGKGPRKPDRTKFSGHRGELEAWWLERSELLYHDCPLPPRPPTLNMTNLGAMMEEASFMSGLMQQASQWSRNQEETESWKKVAVQKFTNPLNYERFSGMAKVQALWYIWMGDPGRAVVMVEAWQGFERDKTAGKVLDEDNVVVELILDSTLSNLSGRGMCIGQSTIDARLTPKSQCDTCLSPASSGKKRQGLNVLTCLDKEANGEFGHKGVRVNVAKLLYAVYKFGVNKDFETSASHCFREALHTFLEHSFTVLYWRIKPTNPMTAATETEAVPRFIELLNVNKKLDVNEWVNSCTTVLGEALVKHCSSKLGQGDVKKLCELFRSKMNKILTEFKKLVKDEAKSTPSEELTEKDVSMDLLRKTVAPTMAQQFKRKWRLLSNTKRKKMLTTDKKCLFEACCETFKQMEMIDENNGGESTLEQEMSNGKESEVSATLSYDEECFESQEVTNCEETKSSIPVTQSKLSKESENDIEIETHFPAKCSGDSCPCTDSHKFWQHLVGVLSGDKNPIPFYKCLPNGEIMLKGDLFQDQEGNFFDDIIVLNEEFISGTIMPIEDEIFSECLRLSLLCKMACHRIVPMLLMNIIHEFAELEKKDNIRFECQPCQGCGQLESQPGDFRRCGGCKSVYYCGKKCQAQDWKAGHKQKCQAPGKDK